VEGSGIKMLFTQKATFQLLQCWY